MKTPWILLVILFFAATARLPAGAPVDERQAAARRDAACARTAATAALALERMRKHLEEWGTVNVSQPLIYPVNGQFSLGADNEFSSFKEYYTSELANVTASAGQLDQMALAASASATYNTPQFTSPPAQNTGSQANTPGQPANTPGANPQFPYAAPATTTPSEAPTSQAKGYLEQQTFRKPGDLLRAVPNGNSPRSAINQSVTDKITELLLRKLANPPAAGDGSKLFLAIFQVTCNPGWRTLKGYMADVFVHWEYAQRFPNGDVSLSLSKSGEAPSVVAILPLVDAQNMDLNNSQRELYSLIASLAASGAFGGGNAAGKGVLDYIHSYQKDAASRNAMPVVNSYSTQKGMGFRFSPSFVAISDPARKKSPAANVLIPTSFPVLAVLSMRDPTQQGYNELATQVNFRWLVRDRYISLYPWKWHLPERRENEGRRLLVAHEADGAYKKVRNARDELAKDPDRNLYTNAQYQFLRTDLDEMVYKMGANWSYSPIGSFFKKSDQPKITSCEPQKIDPTIDAIVKISGENLKADGLRVFLGGQECTVVGADDKGLVVLFKAARLNTWEDTTKPRMASSSNDTPIPSERVYTNLVVASKLQPAATPIPVDLTRQKFNDDKDAMRSMQIERDEDGNIKSINFSQLGTLASKDALDAAAKILSPDSGGKSDDDNTNSDGTKTPGKKSNEKK